MRDSFRNGAKIIELGSYEKIESSKKISFQEICIHLDADCIHRQWILSAAKGYTKHVLI